jgi:hypothetical protein
MELKTIMLRYIMEKEGKPPLSNLLYHSPSDYPRVVDVIDVKVKDFDDGHGYMGEHYIVKCIVAEVEGTGTTDRLIHKEKECLVEVTEFKKFLGKQNSIIWI